MHFNLFLMQKGRKGVEGTGAATESPVGRVCDCAYITGGAGAVAVRARVIHARAGNVVTYTKQEM